MSSIVQDRVRSVFERVFNIENYSVDLKMIDVDEWDSLKHINLMMELESEFNIQIQFQNIIEMITVQKIIEVIENMVGND